MKQLSVVVRRHRAGLVREAFRRTEVAAVGVSQAAAAGLGPAPQLQHRGRPYDDDRALRLEAVASDAQVDAVAALIRESCGDEGYLLWSLPVDGRAPAAAVAQL